MQRRIMDPALLFLLDVLSRCIAIPDDPVPAIGESMHLGFMETSNN